MKAIIEKTFHRETTETKTPQIELIFKERVVRTMRFFGIRVMHLDSSYECEDKKISDKDGTFFRQNKNKNK